VVFEPTISAGTATADLRLKPRAHWDRHYKYFRKLKYVRKVGILCVEFTKNKILSAVSLVSRIKREQVG
jgi:hypothetical protein